jgi:hypothetical protein
VSGSKGRHKPSVVWSRRWRQADMEGRFDACRGCMRQKIACHRGGGVAKLPGLL